MPTLQQQVTTQICQCKATCNLYAHNDTKCAAKQNTAYLFFVEIPQEYAVVFTATYHPLALSVCRNEGSKETEVLIHMTCRA